MIVAFASKDGKNVDEHFGWCQTFYLYECAPEGYAFLKQSDASQQKENEMDKLSYKIECLQGADMVCVTQIGPKASTLVKSEGIFPMKVSGEGESIEGVLQKLQNLMQSEMPPLWLRQIMQK